MPYFRSGTYFTALVDDCGRMRLVGKAAFRPVLRSGGRNQQGDFFASLIERLLACVEDLQNPEPFMPVRNRPGAVQDAVQKMLALEAQGLLFRNIKNAFGLAPRGDRGKVENLDAKELDKRAVWRQLLRNAAATRIRVAPVLA